MSAGLEVKRAKNGKGIFTKRPLKQSQVVFEVVGERKHYQNVNKKGGTFQDNTFRFSKDYYLSPAGKLGDYLNHSCDPNAGVKKKNNKLYIVAMDNIKKGSEIVIDYSTILAGDDSWTMCCSCKSRNCRKVIKDFHSLPKNLQERYKDLGVVPKHILEN